MEMVQEFLSTREIAALLKVHPQTVRRWLLTGKIRPSAKTPSGRPLYLAADVVKA